MKYFRPVRSERAFTLVELLVVIGITSLLMGILVPALARARASARDIKCLSNLRQLGIGFAAYAIDYKGAWPKPAQTAKTPPLYWHNKFLYATIYGQDPPTSKMTDNSWIPGTIFECPSATDYFTGSNYIESSYGMTARLNDVVGNGEDGRGDFKYSRLVRDASVTCLLIDSTQPWAGTNTTATPAPSNNQLLHLQDAAVTRHHNRLNALFVDLHAESVDYNEIPTVHSSNDWFIFWTGTR